MSQLIPALVLYGEGKKKGRSQLLVEFRYVYSSPAIEHIPMRGRRLARSCCTFARRFGGVDEADDGDEEDGALDGDGDAPAGGTIVGREGVATPEGGHEASCREYEL